MNKKPKRKTDRQKTIARLDVLFSGFIRKRAMQRVSGCERAKYVKGHKPTRDWKELDCAHRHSRRKLTVRWDERNAAGLCGGCHMYLDSHPEEQIEFFRNLLGEEEYEGLYIRANMTTKQSLMDYNLIEIYLKQKIKELEE